MFNELEKVINICFPFCIIINQMVEKVKFTLDKKQSANKL